jgi:hypothetical protein
MTKSPSPENGRDRKHHKDINFLKAFLIYIYQFQIVNIF